MRKKPKKFLETDEDLLNEFVTNRNLSPASRKIYSNLIREYTNFHHLSLEKLIDEADQEEEQRIRQKKRKIKKRILDYRTHIVKNGMAPSNIKNSISKIKTIYRHYDIEIPNLPPLQLKEDRHERITDIPTIEHIQTAVEGTNNKLHKAIILFMSSSGSAAAETTNLTIQTFLNATQNYHSHPQDLLLALDDMHGQDDIVPLFEMIRQKTNYPYYTCCTPEASEAIINYLEERILNEPTPPILNSKLFKLKSKRSLMSIFDRINDRHGWGKGVRYNFFHSHALRKFNATTIRDVGFANKIQGRKSDRITEAYFKTNPELIRQEYMKYIPDLTIRDTEVKVITPKDYKDLENKVNDTEERLKEFDRLLKKLDL